MRELRLTMLRAVVISCFILAATLGVGAILGLAPSAHADCGSCN